MGLNKFFVYGSLLMLLFLEKAENPECRWNLSSYINQNFQFDSIETMQIPCSVEQDFRSWEKKIIPLINEYSGEVKMLLTYKNGEKTYYEVWNTKTKKLEILIADENYYNIQKNGR